MGTILKEQDIFNPLRCPNPEEPVTASDIFGSSYEIGAPTIDGRVSYTPVVTNVRVRHLGGISKVLAVTVLGSDITVQVGTDGLGQPTSRGIDLVAAFNAVTSATNLASVLPEGTGLGLVGIWENWLPLGDGLGDDLGSVRPGFQCAANRTHYLREGTLRGKRTFKSLVVDATGEVAVVAPESGVIQASSALRVNLPGSEGPQIEYNRTVYRNVTAASNPANTVALKNELRPLTYPKSFGTIITNGMGGFSVVEGASFTAAIVALTIEITLLTPFDNPYYHVSPSIEGSSLLKPTTFWKYISNNKFALVVQENLNELNPNLAIFRVGFSAWGKQV